MQGQIGERDFSSGSTGRLSRPVGIRTTVCLRRSFSTACQTGLRTWIRGGSSAEGGGKEMY